MTLYKFYLKPTKEKEELFFGRNYTIEERYPLHAVTTKKKYAKKFLKTRNKDMFVFIQTDDVDESDESYESFAKFHRMKYLKEYPLKCYRSKDKEDIIFGTIIATENEIDHTIETMEMGAGVFASIEAWIPLTGIFSQKIANALRLLKYDKISQLLGNELYSADGHLLHRLDFDYSITDVDVSFDQLSVYLTLYHELLSPDFYDEIEWNLSVPKSFNSYRK